VDDSAIAMTNIKQGDAGHDRSSLGGGTISFTL